MTAAAPATPGVLDLFRLDGRVALVTGASRGLGQAMAVALAQAGADVIGVATGDMQATAQQVQATGRRFLALPADLRTGADLQPLVDQALRWQGRLDVLVNNAGMIRRADAIDYTAQDWDDVLQLNLRAVFLLTQAVARHWRAAQRGGKVIHITSMLSFQGGIRVPAYTAAKSGLLGLTRALANEWAPHGIHVNSIAPGYMETDNTAALRADAQRSSDILARIPAQRWGQPADLAGALVFLASAASSYVHGHTLAVDGGWLAR